MTVNITLGDVFSITVVVYSFLLNVGLWSLISVTFTVTRTSDDSFDFPPSSARILKVWRLAVSRSSFTAVLMTPLELSILNLNNKWVLYK